jgi:transmembrane sensor
MDELLVKYMLHEANAGEVLQVEQWLRADEANRRYFEGLKLIWQESRNIAKISNVDENAAWLRFQERIAKEKATVHSLEPRVKRITWKVWSMAAALAVLILGSWMAITYFQNNDALFESSDAPIVCRLPDGSSVTLNKHSKLSYQKTNNGIRAVQLSGEAFFDVVSDKAHPFIISVADAQVRVVGTTFNIRSDNDQTEISVETGVVDVSKNNHKVQVVRNEKAIVSRTKEAPVKMQRTDNLYNYYRSKEIVCNGTPLNNVVNMLSEAYEVTIVVQNSEVARQPLNTTIPAGATLDDIINMLAATFNLQVVKGNQQIVFY